MLKAENIFLAFNTVILKKVDLQIDRGEVLGLVGKSGAGKSSLLKILSGNLQTNSGKVFFDHKELPPAQDLLIPGYKKIELVNQDFKLDSYHTVEENIREAILYLPNEFREKRIKKMLRLFELKHLANEKAHLISGGEQQRVAIARSVAKNPDFLLLDEPFGNLDTLLKNKLKQYIQEIRAEENTGIVLVSHDAQDVLGMSDSICLLKNGVLSKKYGCEEIYYDLKNLAQSQLFGYVNKVVINGQEERFRPDEYEINNSGIPIQFIRSNFTGGYYENIFISENKERIVLNSTMRMDHVSNINVSRKKFN